MILYDSICCIHYYNGIITDNSKINTYVRILLITIIYILSSFIYIKITVAIDYYEIAITVGLM